MDPREEAERATITCEAHIDQLKSAVVEFVMENFETGEQAVEWFQDTVQPMWHREAGENIQLTADDLFFIAALANLGWLVAWTSASRAKLEGRWGSDEETSGEENSDELG